MAVPDAATALAAGQLAGAVLVEPVLTRLIAGGKVRILRDGAGLIGGLTVSTVRGPFLRQNPQVVAAYRQALYRAGKLLAAQPEEAINLASQETKLPAELVRKIAAKYSFLDIPREEMHKELLAVIDFLADRKMIARRPALTNWWRIRVDERTASSRAGVGQRLPARPGLPVRRGPLPARLCRACPGRARGSADLPGEHGRIDRAPGAGGDTGQWRGRGPGRAGQSRRPGRCGSDGSLFARGRGGSCFGQGAPGPRPPCSRNAVHPAVCIIYTTALSAAAPSPGKG